MHIFTNPVTDMYVCCYYDNYYSIIVIASTYYFQVSYSTYNHMHRFYTYVFTELMSSSRIQDEKTLVLMELLWLPELCNSTS